MMYSILGDCAVHADIAAVLHSLGNVFQIRGKLSEAVAMFQKSLDINYEPTVEILSILISLQL